jgi:hypothetical protein
MRKPDEKMKTPKLGVIHGKPVTGRLIDPSPEVLAMLAAYRRKKSPRALLVQLVPGDEPGTFTGRLCEFSGQELRVLKTEAGILANLIEIQSQEGGA